MARYQKMSKAVYGEYLLLPSLLSNLLPSLL